MKILFTTKYAPYPTRGGSSQRSLHLYKALSALGSVTMITLESPAAFSEDDRDVLTRDFGLHGIGPVTAAGEKPLWAPLRAISPRIADQLAHNLDASRSRFLPDRRLRERLDIDTLLRTTDLVVGRYATSLTKLGLHQQALPTVLDVDDLDSDIYRSRLAITRSGSLAHRVVNSHLKHIEQREPDVFKSINALWVANPDNLQRQGLERATVLPNIPWQPDGESFNSTPVQAGNLEVMCIASFGHTPNIEGVQWFIDKVWPGVLQRLPTARFTVYGSSMSESLKARWSAAPAVVAAGFVDSVTPAYATSAVCVCPVNAGAGTNIKVLEAAAHARCCVLTPVASRGFGTDPALAPHLQVCADAERMASRIVELIENPQENNRIAQAAQAAVSAHYSSEAFSRIVRETIAALPPKARTSP